MTSKYTHSCSSLCSSILISSHSWGCRRLMPVSQAQSACNPALVSHSINKSAVPGWLDLPGRHAHGHCTNNTMPMRCCNINTWSNLQWLRQSRQLNCAASHLQTGHGSACRYSVVQQWIDSVQAYRPDSWCLPAAVREAAPKHPAGRLDKHLAASVHLSVPCYPQQQAAALMLLPNLQQHHNHPGLQTHGWDWDSDRLQIAWCRLRHWTCLSVCCTGT